MCKRFGVPVTVNSNKETNVRNAIVKCGGLRVCVKVGEGDMFLYFYISTVIRFPFPISSVTFLPKRVTRVDVSLNNKTTHSEICNGCVILKMSYSFAVLVGPQCLGQRHMKSRPKSFPFPVFNLPPKSTHFLLYEQRELFRLI